MRYSQRQWRNYEDRKRKRVQGLNNGNEIPTKIITLSDSHGISSITQSKSKSRVYIIHTHKEKKSTKLCRAARFTKTLDSDFTKNRKKKTSFYGVNEVRRSDKAFGAPERIVEICSMSLQLRRKPAVYNCKPACLLEEIFHRAKRRLRASGHHLSRLGASCQQPPQPTEACAM